MTTMTAGAALFALAIVLGIVVSPVFFLFALVAVALLIVAGMGMARASRDPEQTTGDPSPARRPGSSGAPADGEGAAPGDTGTDRPAGPAHTHLR